MDSLIKSGLDTFFVYYPYCYSDGYVSPKNATEEQLREFDCDHTKQSYIFYKNKGNTYVTKINECHSYSPIKLDLSPSFSYFTTHFQALIQDTVRDAAYIDKDGRMYYQSIDHSCYRVFYFSGKQKKYIYIDLYEFNKTLDKKKTNINYSYNMKTHLKKLIDIVYKEIEGLKFTRQETISK